MYLIRQYKPTNTKSIMKKNLLFILLLFAGLANAQVVPIPDPAFTAKLIALGIDTNADGAIQQSEALAVTTLDIRGANIAVLDGIASFTNLISLNCNFNLLSALDVSALSHLTTLNCYGNQITILKVNGLTTLETLNCGYNRLTTLNVTGLPNLKSLDCTLNQFTTLNVTGLNLERLGIGHNPLPSLNAVTGITTNLLELGCEGLKLTAINVSAYPKLKSLSVLQNQIASFDAITGLTSNLEVLYCSSNQMTSLNVSGFPNLQKLYCSSNLITSLNVSGLTKLEELNCGLNQLPALNVTGLTSLKTLSCDNNLLTILNLTGLTNLENLSCHKNLFALNVAGLTKLKAITCSYDEITTTDFSGLSNLETLTIYGGAGPTTLNLTGLSSITELNCSGLGLTAINLAGLTSLKTLNCSENQLTTLNLTGLVNLENLSCRNNQLTALNLAGFNKITDLDCGYNQLTTLDVTGMPNLKNLFLNTNKFASLNLANNINLEALYADNNDLTGLNVSDLVNLSFLKCETNKITGLNLSNNPKLATLQASDNLLTSLVFNANKMSLRYLDYGNNPLPNFDITGYTELTRLDVDNTGRNSLDVSKLTKLFVLNCNDNPIPVIDVTNNYKLENFGCGSTALTSLFMKNGSHEIFDIFPSPNLKFVCTDEVQTQEVQDKITATGNTTCVINSYCSFVPGGTYNTITGSMLFDANNNGCDSNDIKQPNIKININDGTTTGDTFTNALGTYSFYTLTGNFNITPKVENPDFFNFSPATAAVAFINNNNNLANQGFCISANGVHPDLEVVIAPAEGFVARPGFDAKYKIVYKNIGNQVLTGNVTFNYNDAIFDFITASQTPNAAATGLLTWNYANLLPFESRSYTITLNLNSPLETPAVNINELLSFTANVNPVTGDENRLNNQFVFKQVVVGSYDPNDITCLEGRNVSPDEIGQYLHYNVNFENTGTAAAENVVVKLAIDKDKFDIGSLQLMNTSHVAYAVVTDNIVEFKFEKINLPPSASAGDPPVNGHGNVLFKIKTLKNLEIGDHVNKEANIYFDYNAPIETNNAETVFEVLSSQQFTIDNSIVLYPNPTNAVVNIKSRFTIKAIELYDIQGRVLQTTTEHENNVTFNISNRQSGVYFIKIISDQGSIVAKVIKE